MKTLTVCHAIVVVRRIVLVVLIAHPENASVDLCCIEMGAVTQKMAYLAVLGSQSRYLTKLKKKARQL